MSDDLKFARERDAADRAVAEHADYPKILLRRRWWVLGPLFLCGLSGYVVSQRWPLLYRSEASVIVEQPQVADRYVTQNVRASLQNRADAIRQQILSRARLQQVVVRFGLYPAVQALESDDHVAELFRKQIGFEVMRAPDATGEVGGFWISFKYSDPEVARQVTQELTTEFIEEDVRGRSEQATGTTQFLDDQLVQAEQALAVQEKLVAQYKQRYAGELPEQERGNLQLLAGLETQLHSTTAALDRAEQERVYQVSMQRHYQTLRKAVEDTEETPDAESAAVPSAAETTLRELQARLALLRARYTDSYPDVESTRLEIEKVKILVAAARQNPAVVEPTSKPRHSQAPIVQTAQAETESRLAALNTEIETLKKKADEIGRRVQEQSRLLSSTPVRGQDLIEMLRNLENARNQYQSLVSKRHESELTSDLEKRRQGEHFKVLNYATLPQSPEGRGQIVAVGWMLGLCCGIGLVFLREKSDRSVHSKGDLSECTPLPLIVKIPIIRTTRENRKRGWFRGLEIATVSVLVLVSVATAVRTLIAS